MVAKPHEKSQRTQEGRQTVPTVSMDYMYLNSAQDDQAQVQEGDEGSGMPVLVMIDDATDMVFSSVAPRKGVHPCAIVRVSNDLALMGHTHIIVKTDKETPFTALKNAVNAESSQRIEVDRRVEVVLAQVLHCICEALRLWLTLPLPN